MGDRVYTTIKFGGQISAAKAEELLELVHDTHSGMELDDLRDTLEFEEVNYGDLSDLEDFATENGLDYAYYCGSGWEFSAVHKRYYAGTNELLEASATDDGPALTEQQLREYPSIGAAIDFFGRLNRKVPPLEIIE